MRQQWEWSRDQYILFEQQRTPPTIKRLIIANIVVFVVQLLFSQKGILEYYFGLSPLMIVRHFWLWQLVTYQFLHSVDSPFHIIFNMLCLYWFGREIQLMLGARRFVIFYLVAGVFAGVAYCLMQLLVNVHVLAIGASGAIMAILVAYALTFPNQLIFFFFLFPMKIKNFVLILIGIDLIYAVNGSPNGVANFAHLGGALFGAVYWKGRPFLNYVVERIQDWRESHRRNADIEEEHDLDRILEKISQYGMDSLTRSERSFLLRASQRRKRQKFPQEGHA